MRLLDQQKISYKSIAYTYDNENLNVVKIAHENNLPLAAIFKTLVLQGDQTAVLIALVAGHQQLSFKKLAAHSNNKKISLVATKALPKLTGYIRGACSPLALKKNYPIFADKNLLDWETVYINAGTKGILLQLSPQDLTLICPIKFIDLNLQENCK